MQPTTSFDWGRQVTPARWIARALGIVQTVIMGLLTVGLVFFFGPSSSIFFLLVSLGVIAIGLVAAFVWKGIGEIVGGLLLLGYPIWFVLQSGYGIEPISIGAVVGAGPFVLSGLLFIACGWYTLAHSHPHPHPHPHPHITA